MLTIEDPGTLRRLVHAINGFDLEFGPFEKISFEPTTADEVADGTRKAKLYGQRGKLTAFVLASQLRDDDLVLRNTRNALHAKSLLGNKLGEWVLTPAASGDVDGYRFAVYPYAQPLSCIPILERFVHAKAFFAACRWLEGVSRHTVSKDADREACAKQLDSYINRTSLSPIACKAARRAQSRLFEESWIPRHVFMHGDFWAGNVLNSPWPRRASYVLIDWAGFKAKGFPFYDLLRACSSFDAKGKQLRNLIRVQCDLFECESVDVQSYLAWAMADIGANLECFPKKQYLDLCDRLTDLAVRIC